MSFKKHSMKFVLCLIFTPKLRKHILDSKLCLSLVKEKVATEKNTRFRQNFHALD